MGKVSVYFAHFSFFPPPLKNAIKNKSFPIWGHSVTMSSVLFPSFGKLTKM